MITNLVPLLGVIFVLLIAGSIQSITADHLEPGIGIFKNENQINLILSKDSKYEMFVLVEIRNAQGELVSILESMHGELIPHEISDYVFDTLMGEKEIITFDNIKYEKRQFIDQQEISAEFTTFVRIWTIHLCGDIGGHSAACIPVFQARGAAQYVEKDDVIKNQWVILREMN